MVSDAVWAPAADSPNMRKYGRSSSSEALIPISNHPLGELVCKPVSQIVGQPHSEVAGAVRHCHSASRHESQKLTVPSSTASMAVLH